MNLARKELARYFQEYAGTAQRELSGIALHRPGAGLLTRFQCARLVEVVEWLESQPAFRVLVEATRDAFRDKEHHSSPFYSGWAAAVGHFFRRSGFYLDCFEGQDFPDYGSLFRRYERAFRAREGEAMYLLPLEWVRFVERREEVVYPRREPIECDSFTLRCYSREELESLSENRISRVFYPYAVWDTEKLAWYWYVMVSGSKPVIGIGKILLNFTGLYYVQRRLALDWLAPFQVPLYRLLLYDWLPEGFQDCRDLLEAWPEELEGFSWPATGIRYSVERLIENERYLDWIPWHGFRVPFRLECNGDLIHAPPAAPDTSALELESLEGSGGEEVVCPAGWLRFELDREVTAKLVRLIREEFSVIDASLLNLKEWSFYRTALQYLLKAFLTEPSQAPAEQLLWHVTALEALLGRREDMENSGLVKAIGRRLGRLLGGNADERDRIKYNFTKLYDVRSDLVHGNPWKNYSTLYLYLARNFARQACLRYTELARNCTREGRPLPDRDVIITALNEGRFDELLGKEP